MGLCCRQNKNLSFDANSLKNPSLFVGDSIMKTKFDETIKGNPIK